MNFLMDIMASGIARGHVRTTTTATESRNIAAKLQILGWQRHAALVYRLLLWYRTSMLWSIDTCQNKVSADQYHVTISRAQSAQLIDVTFFLSWPLAKRWFSIGSRVHVRLTCSPHITSWLCNTVFTRFLRGYVRSQRIDRFNDFV